MSYLKSEKVMLRELKEADFFDIHQYASSEIVCQYEPWGPNTEEDTMEFVQDVLSDAKKNPRTRFVFAIVEKEEERVIGAGEFNIRDFLNKSGEIGYVIHPDFWGRGFATSAAELLLGFGFGECKLHRIFATCDPRNEASAKVLEKIGMTKEGRIREDIKMKDGWRDSFIYSILDYEWFG